jgi:hypothetical protein
MDVETLQYLNKYLLREKKYKNILKRDDLKIYMHQRMKIMNLCFESRIVYL